MIRALLSLALLIPFCAPQLTPPGPEPRGASGWSSADLPPYLTIGNYYVPGVVLRSQVVGGRLVKVKVECAEAQVIFVTGR